MVARASGKLTQLPTLCSSGGLRTHAIRKLAMSPHNWVRFGFHHHQAKHWIVVRGTAKVTQGDEEFLLCENGSTYIPQMTKHRLENSGKILLKIIEIQSGSYLDEDDIVRLEDSYGREETGADDKDVVESRDTT